MTIIIHGPDELRAQAGRELGVSDWTDIQQQAVGTFADLTGDHQWIHVDVERVAASPFGSTIVHGYLTLGLVPRLASTIYRVEGFPTDSITASTRSASRLRFRSAAGSGSGPPCRMSATSPATACRPSCRTRSNARREIGRAHV